MEEAGVARTEHGQEALAAEISLPEVTDIASISVDRRALFLRELMRSPVVGRAARQAGLALRDVYALKRADQRFSAAMDEAMSCAIDDIEQAAVDRALAKSDKLLEMLLKAKRPGEYRDTLKVEHSVVGDIEVDLVPFASSQNQVVSSGNEQKPILDADFEVLPADDQDA